jgi:amino acid permease
MIFPVLHHEGGTYYSILVFTFYFFYFFWTLTLYVKCKRLAAQSDVSTTEESNDMVIHTARTYFVFFFYLCLKD